jgi:hypothetical protein
VKDFFMPNGRLDRLTWVVRPENLENYVKSANDAFGVEFEFYDGPRYGAYPKGAGIRSFVSWEGGLEFIAPLDARDPITQQYRDFLDTHGEGSYGFVFGVDDLRAAVTRARKAGFHVSEATPGSPLGDQREQLQKWTTRVTSCEQRPLGEVLGTRITLAHVVYTGAKNPLPRIDHFIWVAQAENVERYVHLLSELLGVRFDHYDGPSYETNAFGIHTYVSWDAGLEVVAPLGDGDQVASHFQAFLAESGEAPYGFVLGVDNLSAACDRARRAGFDVSALLQTPDTELRRSLLHRWTSRVADCQEVLVGEMVGIRTMIGQFDYVD